MTTQQQEPVAPLMNESTLQPSRDRHFPMSTAEFEQFQLHNWFSYHAPTGPEQLAQYQSIRDAGHVFALTIVQNAPPSADRTAAIRKIREAVMTANAAIACGGR